MNANNRANACNLETYRHYLSSLARLNISDPHRGRIDPADIVQQVLLQAHSKLATFRGQSEAELKGWLRTILSHTLANAVRALGTKKRNANLERSIGAGIEDSSCRLENWLAADQSSPSSKAARNELMLNVVQALSELPAAQRTAIEMRYLQQVSIQEICRHLNRSEGAVAGLITRGMSTLRTTLNGFDS